MIRVTSSRKSMMLSVAFLTVLAPICAARQHPITVDGGNKKPHYNQNGDGQNGSVLVVDNDTVHWTCGNKCSSMTIMFSSTPCKEASTFTGSTIDCTINISDTSAVRVYKYTMTVANGDGSSTDPDDPHVIVDNQTVPPKGQKPPLKR
jgi:hypothetical protein